MGISQSGWAEFFGTLFSIIVTLETVPTIKGPTVGYFPHMRRWQQWLEPCQLHCLSAAQQTPDCHCWLTLRATKLRARLAAMKPNEATHNNTSIVRRYEAVGKLIPTPVARATYATTQAGHLGSNASVAPGRIQPATSPPRRNRDAGRRAWSSARVSQQWRAFMGAPRPRGNMSRHSEEAP